MVGSKVDSQGDPCDHENQDLSFSKSLLRLASLSQDI